MRRCFERYGSTFTVRMGQAGDWVFVTDPPAIKQVFTADPHVVHAGEGRDGLEPMFGRRSILLLDGDEHMRERKLMLPPFHGERMSRYRELIVEITDEAIDRWPLGRPFDLLERLQEITLDVILRAVFGLEEPQRLTQMRARLKRLLELTASSLGELATVVPAIMRDFGPLSPARMLGRAAGAVDELLFEEFARRRVDPGLGQRDDILSLLLQARHEDGEPMTDRELRDELITLLLAGHETTATALAWAFERLLRRPDALERLTAEARGDNGDAYAEAVTSEILRLRPPLPIVDRKLTAPFEIAGYELPAGTVVVPCIWLVHRRADLYPEPETFRPERFLAERPETYSWLPFGGGVRRCLGAAFATVEMKLILHAIAGRAVLRPVSSSAERARRRSIVMAPRRGAEVRARDASAARIGGGGIGHQQDSATLTPSAPRAPGRRRSWR